MNETASAKDLLKEEFVRRVREAVKDRNWDLLEHWAKQWVQMDSAAPDGFKWLARAATALNKIPRAAYAYGRLLDFDPQNEEARNFFARYPSILQDQPEKTSQQLERAESGPAAGEVDPARMLNPDQRQKLSTAELSLAELYERFLLFAPAAAHYQQSFDWYPSQIAALGNARNLHKCHRGLDAARFLRQQLFYFSDWIDGRILLGRILFEQGQRADAQKEWQTVLQQDPHHPEALNFLRGLYTGAV